MKSIPLIFLAAVAAALPAFSLGEDFTAFAHDFRPGSHFENIPATDASVLQCYVFQTTAGVGYQVEVSNDMQQWTATDEVYGLGHEYVVSMREFTLAPLPEPGVPPSTPSPGPTKSVSIRMQPATGTAGGTVVAWPSLDNGSAVVVKIDGTLDAGWASIPLYANAFGDYDFFVWHPLSAIDPPVANPALGPEDSAMLATLEASLPAMNTEVATSVVRSRNAPPPAPPDPDALRFWRIKVDAGIDTDNDGTYDWVEFQMAANGTSGMIAWVTGDAFNADTNLDGIPDGLQIDSDEDGTPDAADISPSDNTANFPISPVPRYALFPITNAEPPTGWLKPIQISDKGTVLYSNGTWTGGTWTPITTLDNGTGSAFAINDHNHIVGSGTMEIPIGDGNDYRSVGAGCWWESPSAAPETLSVVTEELTLYPNADSLDGLMDISCLPYLSNAGEFLMVTLEVDEEGLLDYTGASLWQLPINNQPVTETAIDAGLFFGNGGMRWGTSNGEPLLTDDA